MICTVDSKEIIKIAARDGKEIAEVRDNQGRLLFENCGTLSGVPPLTFTSRGGNLIDYQIYGDAVNSQGCGDYDAESDGYQIPVTVCGENLCPTSTVSLHKTNSRTRSIQVTCMQGNGYTFTCSITLEEITTLGITFVYDGNYSRNATITIANGKLTASVPKIDGRTINSLYLYISSTAPADAQASLTNCWFGLSTSVPTTTPIYIGDAPLYAGEYLSYREQKIYRNINGSLTPVSAEFPEIQAIEETNILTVDTTVQPSDVYIKYKKG